MWRLTGITMLFSLKLTIFTSTVPSNFFLKTVANQDQHFKKTTIPPPSLEHHSSHCCVLQLSLMFSNAVSRVGWAPSSNNLPSCPLTPVSFPSQLPIRDTLFCWNCWGLPHYYYYYYEGKTPGTVLNWETHHVPWIGNTKNLREPGLANILPKQLTFSKA